MVLDQGNSYSPGWEDYNRKVIYRVKNRQLLPNYGTSQNIAAGDNLLYKFNPGANWTDVGSSSASGHYYWYPYSSGNAYLSLFHVSNYNTIDGRAGTDYHYSNYYGSGMPGGNNSWHHGSRMLVREMGQGPAEDQVRIVEDENGVRQWSDQEPKRSCKEYKEQVPDGAYTGDLLSGMYRITTPLGVINTYCDMETDGGGWTMVGHYRHPGRTNAPAGINNRDYAYFMRARQNQAFGRPEYVGDPNSEGAWTDWRHLEGMSWPLEFAIVLDQGRSYQTNWEGHSAKIIYRVKNRQNMPNYGTAQPIAVGDNLLYKTSPANNWTDVGGSSASGHYYWYPYSSGGQYLTLFHVSNYSYIDGRAGTDYHYSNYYGAGVPGGNNSWHHGSRLLIREIDELPDPDRLRVALDENGIRGWTNGATRRTCKHYLDDVPDGGDASTLVSGKYRIDTPNGRIVVYCDMETDGGGWTMLGHYRHPGRSNAPNDVANNRDYAYFMKARQNATFGRREYLADPDSDGAWTDFRPLEHISWPIEYAIVLDQGVAYQPQWDNRSQKVIYRVKNRNIMPNYGTQQNLTAGDNLLYKFNPNDNWTDVGSSSRSGHYYWYPYSSGNAYLSLFHVSNYSYIDGRAGTDYHYSNYYGSGMPGGNNSWHHGSRMLFRETEPLPAVDVLRIVEEDGVRTWSDGQLETTCLEYRNGRDGAYTPSIISGKYRLDTPAGQIVAYCDMETDGGGWTLVGHYRHPGRTNAPNDVNNRDYAYYMKARENRAYGRPTYIGDPGSGGPWTDWRLLSAFEFPLEFAVVLDQGRNVLTNWEDWSAKAIYRVARREVMPNYGTRQDLTSGNNLLYKLNPGDNWTDVGGASASGIYYWYPYSSGGQYLTLFHVSNYNYIDGRAATDYHYSNYYGAGVPGGNNSWHHGSHMWIRELQ